MKVKKKKVKLISTDKLRKEAYVENFLSLYKDEVITLLEKGNKEKKTKMAGEEAPSHKKAKPSAPVPEQMEEDNEGEFIQVSPKKSSKKLKFVPFDNKIPTTSVNPFGILKNLNDERCSEKGSVLPTVKIPPIIIKGIIPNFQALIDDTRKTLGHGNFTVTYGRQHRIYVNSIEDQTKLLNSLKEHKVDHHTFARGDQRMKKLVLKAAPGLSVEELSREIKDQTQQTPSQIIEMKSKNKNVQSHSYLVQFGNDSNLSNVKSITGLNNIRVKWESYTKRQTITQCHRCQEYGHGQRFCFSEPKCLKCGEKHFTSDCVKCNQINFKPKCCNCGGQHVASYSQCAAALKYIEKIERIQQKRFLDSQPRRFDANANKLRSGVQYSAATSNQNDFPSLRQTPKTQQRDRFLNSFTTQQTQNQNSIQSPSQNSNQNHQNDQDDMQTLINELKQIQQEFDIKALIAKVRGVKNQLRAAKDEDQLLEVVKANMVVLDGLQ